MSNGIINRLLTALTTLALGALSAGGPLLIGRACHRRVSASLHKIEAAPARTSRSNPNSTSVTRAPGPIDAPSAPRNPIEPPPPLNDPFISANWGLGEIGAPKAWHLTRGDRDVVVAVIDTGVDVFHPDLHGNIWWNPGESGHDARGRDKASNGVDDDGNGFADDVHGWNFVSQSPDVSDRHGHGTHIAGIIGAVGDNARGASGVAPRVSLMVLKYQDPGTPGPSALRNTIRAIRYAIAMKADIINYSAGGLEPNDEEKAAIREAAAHGILFVAAAGNERLNSDRVGYYPAGYDLPNILSVAASDRRRALFSLSNYGRGSVDLAAPGKDILSTQPGGGYVRMSGTSQATAFATGAAALLLSRHSGPGKIDPSKD